MEIRPCGSTATRRGPAEWFTGTVMQDPIIERAADLEPAEAVAIWESGKAATLVMTGQLDSEGSAEVNVPIDVLRLRTALNVARLFDWTSESRLNAWVHGSRRRGT